MRPSAASTDAAATGAESRSPGKLYALATVGLAIFLLGIILAPPRPQTHIARAVVAYRAAADTQAASARLSGEKALELTALLQSEGTLRAVLARLAADARTGFGKAAPTADELRTRLAIEPAPSDRPDEAWIAVHYRGASHDQSLAVAEAICQEFVTSQTAHDGSAHRRVTAARAELAEAQERADAAYEKLETYLAAHFAKLENGPELIAAALRGMQLKPLANAAKPAGPPQPSNPTVRPAGPATIVNAHAPPAIKPNPAPPAAPAVKPEPPPLPVVVSPSVTPPGAAPATPAVPRIAPGPPAPPAIVTPSQPPPAAPPAVSPPPAPSIPVAAPPPPPAPPAVTPTGPRLNPAYAAIQKRLADVKLQQESLAATHTWAHPIVRGLVDEEQELKKQLRATPEILPTEQPAPPDASNAPAPAPPAAEAPVEPAVPPPPGPSLGPASRDPGGFRGWAIPRTSAPPAGPAAPVGDPIDELLAQLFSKSDHEIYLALQADYAGWQERVQAAALAERQAADALASRPASAASLREPPHVTARFGGGVCTSQLLLWAALAGTAGCLVAFWAGEIEPSPTLDRADDVANRLGLPVVATLPTSGAPLPPAAPPEPPAWVAVAVRIAEFTLAGIAILLVVGVVRSSELAGQLASDPLTTLIECCAWWRR